MGIVPTQLAADLGYRLRLERAIETGTLKGHGVSALSPIFPEVVSIELAQQFYDYAREAFAGQPHVRIVHGSSAVELIRLVDSARPTFYFLDAHWSGGTTAGEDSQCPVLEELDAICGGSERDCIVIDDARLFREPPQQHDPLQWPSLEEISSRLERMHPGHRIGIVDDQIVCVPAGVWWIVELWRTTVERGRRPLRAQLLRLARHLRRKRAQLPAGGRLQRASE